MEPNKNKQKCGSPDMSLSPVLQLPCYSKISSYDSWSNKLIFEINWGAKQKLSTWMM